ncbi:hypothetical protein C7271_09755 [filamentous cyanobacterium CCP5]|nr:hypothetical protein C7271_09755 [filamentous cyanobacterium CCP5]
MERFTRRETLVLTRTSLGQLAYFAKTKLISPHRCVETQAVYYTWEQVLEIRAINRLRRHLSLQTIRKIICFLQEQGFDTRLRDKHLVILADGVSWVRSEAETVALVQLTDPQNRHPGQLLLSLPPWSQLVKDRWEATTACQVVDLEQFRSGSRPSS